MRTENIIKGKRPEMFETPGVDYLIHMVMVLTQELNVANDQVDTLKRVLLEKEVLSADELEQFSPDQNVLEQREIRRQTMLDTLFSVIYQEAAEIERKDSKQKFHQTIKDIASE